LNDKVQSFDFSHLLQKII